MAKGSKRKRAVPPNPPPRRKPAPARRTGEGLPWSPVGIFAWALLGGPVVGGAFAYVNTRRLGLSEYERPTLLMALLGIALPILVGTFVFHVPNTSPAYWNIDLLCRAAAAYYFTYTQREAFWEHMDAGGRKASGFWPSAVSIVFFVVEIAFAFRPA